LVILVKDEFKGMVNILTKIKIFMKENLNKIKKMEKVNFLLKMEINFMKFGKKIKELKGK
jgi:hypothetical protein